jgi:hypothetical protein
MTDCFTRISQYAGAHRKLCCAAWAEKDRCALLCQHNGYLGQKDGAA